MFFYYWPAVMWDTEKTVCINVIACPCAGVVMQILDNKKHVYHLCHHRNEILGFISWIFEYCHSAVLFLSSVMLEDGQDGMDSGSLTPGSARQVCIQRHPSHGFGFIAGSERPVVVRSVSAGKTYLCQELWARCLLSPGSAEPANQLHLFLKAFELFRF